MIISVSQKEGSPSQSIFLNCLLGGGLGGGSQETSRSFPWTLTLWPRMEKGLCRCDLVKGHEMGGYPGLSR